MNSSTPVICLGDQGLETHSLAEIGSWTSSMEFSGSTPDLMNQTLGMGPRNLQWTSLPGNADTLEFGDHGTRFGGHRGTYVLGLLNEWPTATTHLSTLTRPSHTPPTWPAKEQKGHQTVREILILIQHKVNSRHLSSFSLKISKTVETRHNFSPYFVTWLQLQKKKNMKMLKQK